MKSIPIFVIVIIFAQIIGCTEKQNSNKPQVSPAAEDTFTVIDSLKIRHQEIYDSLVVKTKKMDSVYLKLKNHPDEELCIKFLELLPQNFVEVSVFYLGFEIVDGEVYDEYDWRKEKKLGNYYSALLKNRIDKKMMVEHIQYMDTANCFSDTQRMKAYIKFTIGGSWYPDAMAHIKDVIYSHFRENLPMYCDYFIKTNQKYTYDFYHTMIDDVHEDGMQKSYEFFKDIIKEKCSSSMHIYEKVRDEIVIEH